MKASLLNKLATLQDRFEELTALLGDAEVISNQPQFRAYSKEYAEVEPVVQAYRQLCKVQEDLEGAQALLKDSDPDLREMAEEEVASARNSLVELEDSLQRMLLPKEELAEGEEEEADPRQQLVEMLVEYRRIKRAAVELTLLKQDADRFWQRPPMFANYVERTIAQYSPQDLLLALASMTNNEGRPAAYIEPQAFSVQEKMTEILHKLQSSPQGFILSDLLQSGQRGETVAAFLGVLELLKMSMITISQAQAFAPIYIFAKQGDTHESR